MPTSATSLLQYQDAKVASRSENYVANGKFDLASIKTLEESVLYVHSLRASFSKKTKNNAKGVKSVHLGHLGDVWSLKRSSRGSGLLVPSFYTSVIPSERLVSLFARCGLLPDDYSAAFLGCRSFMRRGSGSKFVVFCVRGSPNARKFNPYLASVNNQVRANKAMRKIAGLPLCYQELQSQVLTFPKPISNLLLDESMRVSVLERIELCAKDYLRGLELHYLVDVDSIDDYHLGACYNIHSWSSSYPARPHAHVHVAILPFSAPNLSSGGASCRRMAQNIVERQFGTTADKLFDDLERAKWRNDGSGSKVFMSDFESDDNYSAIKDVLDSFRFKVVERLGAKPLKNFLIKRVKGRCVRVAFHADVCRDLWRAVVVKHFPDSEIPPKLNVNLAVKFGRRAIQTGLKYNCRSPLQDIDKYLRDGDLHGDDNFDFLKWAVLEFKNKTKTFGFWNRLKHFSIMDASINRFCPLSGEESFSVDAEFDNDFKIDHVFDFGHQRYACFEYGADHG